MLLGQGKKLNYGVNRKGRLVREDWLSEELPREEKLPPELRTISL